MHPNEQLIQTFYESFARKDHEGMAACYRDDVHFSDPVFPSLDGKRACAMWHMLCTGATDLEITFSNVSADDDKGQAQWRATYTFQLTGKKVLNEINASFQFVDGKIVSHTDVFDFWRWSRMAFGFTGVLLGGTPILKNKVRSTVKQRLDRFIEKNPQYRVIA